VFDEPLSEAELATALLCEAEQGSRLIVPKKGAALREDGTVKIAIIRPCMSRGRAIRGMRPIYTPTMLREHAGVFTGWPMFRDHAMVVAESVQEAEAEARQQLMRALVEEWGPEDRIEEAVKKVGRSIDDLGGRIVRSWWDPNLVFEDDAEYGYQKGGVVGFALPLPSVRTMIEADAGVLHTSINGYPTGGRPGAAPWNGQLKGMLIEGIRRIPVGSVDWVVRGGAGGRVLVEGEEPAQEREVTSPQSDYGSAGGNDVKIDANTSPDELRRIVQEHAPQLAAVLRESQGQPPAAPAPTAAATADADKPLTRAELAEALQRSQEQFATSLREAQETAKRESDEREALNRQASLFEQEAHRLIEAASKARGGILPQRWVADLKARYTVRPSGPSQALLVEAEMDGETVVKDAITVLREQVEADLDYAKDLIAEAAGRPVVTAQGAGGGAAAGAATGQAPARTWADDLLESGIVERGEDGKPKLDGLFEAMEG
jgi:hypothetical protein